MPPTQGFCISRFNLEPKHLRVKKQTQPSVLMQIVLRTQAAQRTSLPNLVICRAINKPRKMRRLCCAHAHETESLFPKLTLGLGKREFMGIRGESL